MAGRSAAEIGIAQGDARVAHEAAPFSALDGAAAANAAEFRFVHRSQPFKPGQRERFLLRLCRLWRDERLYVFSGSVLQERGSDCCGKSSGAEFFFRSCGGAAVPRTNVLANVAAEYLASPWLSQFARHSASQLEGKVRGTAPRIHY